MTDPYASLTFLGDEPEPPLRLPRAGGVHGMPASAALESAGAALLESLCGAWGLDATDYRDSILTRRLGACLRALGVTSPADGLTVLATDPKRSERALGALMIGVTEFFRDPAAFAALDALLPLLKRPDRPLKVLSVGCSDGSELYSVALLLAEHGLLEEAELHGVDARMAAVEAARAGVYPAGAVAALPPERRNRWFAPTYQHAPRRQKWLAVPECVRVVEPLRRACTWSVADALHMSPPAVDEGYDLVLCRNLAIYLTPDASVRLWNVCVEQLRPDGLLMAGKAERPPAELRGVLRSVGPCIQRKRSAPCT